MLLKLELLLDVVKALVDVGMLAVEDRIDDLLA